MKENNMKPRRLPKLNGASLQGKSTNKHPLIQTRLTSCAPQMTVAKPFTGKVFYLDLTSNKLSLSLESDIKDLGGTVEKFFSKEIKYLVSSKKEAKYVQCLRQDSPVPSPESGPSSPHPRSNPHQSPSQGDKSVVHVKKNAFAASRGKSLVKRVIKEQERIQMKEILSNALDWGVKILYLDDVLAYVQKKKKAICSNQHPAKNVVKTIIKTESLTKHGFQKCKGGRISKPFIKVEDSSRHYRPFYLSFTNVPEFNLKGRPPCTPFCMDDKDAPGDRPQGHRGARASATDEKANERKKNKKQGGYCECCQVKYDNLTTHLQGDRHKTFAKSNKYLVVDKLVSTMNFNFLHMKSNIKRPTYSISSALIAPRPFVKKLKGNIDTLVITEEEPLSQCTIEGREEDDSGTVSRISNIPVVHRTTKRRKRCTFSDTSKHKPKQPCQQDLKTTQDVLPLMRELSPSKGESKAPYPVFASEIQHNSTEHLSPTDDNRSCAPQDINVHNESSGGFIVTQQDSKLKSFTSGTTHSENVLHDKMSDNYVLQRDDSCEDFDQVHRIQRKIKVYKRKRRKITTPVSCELIEQNDAADDGMMTLWELFQASDDMDSEFHGFDV